MAGMPDSPLTRRDILRLVSKKPRHDATEGNMLWDLILLVGTLGGWTYALRWALRADRAERASTHVILEAERVLREAPGSSFKS